MRRRQRRSSARLVGPRRAPPNRRRPLPPPERRKQKKQGRWPRRQRRATRTQRRRRRRKRRRGGERELGGLKPLRRIATGLVMHHLESKASAAIATTTPFHVGGNDDHIREERRRAHRRRISWTKPFRQHHFFGAVGRAVLSSSSLFVPGRCTHDTSIASRALLQQRVPVYLQSYYICCATTRGPSTANGAEFHHRQ